MKAERRGQLRNSDFQETVVFSFARWDTPIFLVALNKLHTYFILSELHKEPRRREWDKLKKSTHMTVDDDTNTSFCFLMAIDLDE